MIPLQRAVAIHRRHGRQKQKSHCNPLRHRLEDAFGTHRHIDGAHAAPALTAQSHYAALLGFIGLNRHEDDENQRGQNLQNQQKGGHNSPKRALALCGPSDITKRIAVFQGVSGSGGALLLKFRCSPLYLALKLSFQSAVLSAFLPLFMSPQSLRALLEHVRSGHTPIESAFQELRDLPFEDLGFAKIDHHRALRQGFPEVVFGAGKTPAQIAQIAVSLKATGDIVLITRASAEAFAAVQTEVPAATYDEMARLIQIDGARPKLAGKVGVLCAGTSDLPVAQEAALCLEAMGAEVTRISDVGVAGIHRLLEKLDEIRACRALVVVAGMEGALPSVVAGLVSIPVVAVPTSVGYGAAFGGLAALLGMLNSCSNGIAVVNIDNGFGAAAFVASILRSQAATE